MHCILQVWSLPIPRRLASCKAWSWDCSWWHPVWAATSPQPSSRLLVSGVPVVRIWYCFLELGLTALQHDYCHIAYSVRDNAVNVRVGAWPELGWVLSLCIHWLSDSGWTLSSPNPMWGVFRVWWDYSTPYQHTADNYGTSTQTFSLSYSAGAYVVNVRVCACAEFDVVLPYCTLGQWMYYISPTHTLTTKQWLEQENEAARDHLFHTVRTLLNEEKLCMPRDLYQQST